VRKINITDDEKELLQRYVSTTPVLLLRYKSQAVLLASSGVTAEQVSLAVNRRPSTVENWLGDWVKVRMASIFSKHVNNVNASKLTTDQRHEIKILLSQPPSDSGIPKAMWDIPSLKDYISAQFGTIYESDESYYYLMRFGGLSFKYPDTFDRRRNEEFIAMRMEEIRTEIAPYMASDEWDVYASDEVKMQSEALIRKGWFTKGKRTVIKVDRKKQSQSYIGFLNQKTFGCSMYEMDWQNSEQVVDAMRRFLHDHPDKKICIIWDNAKFHKSQMIRSELARGGVMERVHLINMPPYAPDENPIEHVWNTAKQAVANIQRQTFEETKQAFADYVGSRTFRYSF
jgi:transposase